MESKIYLANIQSGDISDYIENTVFATLDKSKADNWCKRFNSIIRLMKERHKSHDPDNSDVDPFWWCEVQYNNPKAYIRENKLR